VKQASTTVLVQAQAFHEAVHTELERLGRPNLGRSRHVASSIDAQQTLVSVLGRSMRNKDKLRCPPPQMRLHCEVYIEVAGQSGATLPPHASTRPTLVQSLIHALQRLCITFYAST
jgi:hypothetical protein